MSFLLTIAGFFLPVALADTLSEAGAGGSGVAAMWSQICSTLPCISTGGVGGSGLIFAVATAIINFVFPLVSVIAVCLVMYAGILIVTSNGAEDKVSEAKKIILYAVLGVALSLLTSAVMNFLVYYLGIILA